MPFEKHPSWNGCLFCTFPSFSCGERVKKNRKRILGYKHLLSSIINYNLYFLWRLYDSNIIKLVVFSSGKVSCKLFLERMILEKFSDAKLMVTVKLEIRFHSFFLTCVYWVNFKPVKLLVKQENWILSETSCAAK